MPLKEDEDTNEDGEDDILKILEAGDTNEDNEEISYPFSYPA